MLGKVIGCGQRFSEECHFDATLSPQKGCPPQLARINSHTTRKNPHLFSANHTPHRPLHAPPTPPRPRGRGLLKLQSGHVLSGQWKLGTRTSRARAPWCEDLGDREHPQDPWRHRDLDWYVLLWHMTLALLAWHCLLE